MTRWWFPRSLRVRLTVSHVAAMLLVLMVYVAAVFALVSRNASQSLDDRLRGDFRWAAEMAQQGPDGTLTWFEGEDWAEDNPWLVVSSDGMGSPSSGRRWPGGCRCRAARPWPTIRTGASPRCRPSSSRSESSAAGRRSRASPWSFRSAVPRR